MVGPGVSTLYCADDPVGWPTAAHDFFAAFASALPTGLSIRVPNTGDIIDATTGEITGTWVQGTAPALVNGVGGGVYAKGVGLQVKWSTSGITRGRRVKGTTFIVPLIASAFDSDGTLSSTWVTAGATAGNAYITAAAGACIYTRPKPAPGGIGPDSPGKIQLITGAVVPDRVSWLRTRRT